MKPAAGCGLRQGREIIRFASGARPGPKLDGKLGHRIPEIRKLLRSAMTVAEIATELDVSPAVLTGFIRRRQICNLTERKKFISLQISLKKIGECVS